MTAELQLLDVRCLFSFVLEYCNIPFKQIDESFYKYFPVTNGGLGDDTP